MKDKIHAGKITAIRNLPNELATALDGLSDEQLNAAYRAGGWTVRQIVHHIADSHLNAFIRMKLILTEDHPTFKPYDQDLWAKMNDYTGHIAPSVAIISGVQERMANVLKDASETDLVRTAHHPDNGTITLQNLLDMYAGHGKHHVDQIVALREKMAW